MSQSVPGGDFVFNEPEKIPAIWGEDSRVLWACREVLMICGPDGVGQSRLCAAASADRDDAPASSSPTGATITTSTGACFGNAVSSRSSPAARPAMVLGSAGSGGSLSARSPGCTTTVDC